MRFLTYFRIAVLACLLAPHTATPAQAQQDRYTFEGGWTLGVEFSTANPDIVTACSGRIQLLIRDGEVYGDWLVRASDPTDTNPFPCDYTSGSITGTLAADGSVELELLVEHKVTNGGMTTFEYVPWLQDFSEGSSCKVTEDTPWTGTLADDGLSIAAVARCVVASRGFSATFSLRFDGTSGDET